MTDTTPFTIINVAITTVNHITYRITFKGQDGKETTLPVISSSAVQAVADLATLGYNIKKVLHSFPSV